MVTSAVAKNPHVNIAGESSKKGSRQTILLILLNRMNILNAQILYL